MIIVQNHSIDKAVDQLTAMFQFIGIQLSKLKQEKYDLFFCDGWLGALLFLDLVGKCFSLMLQVLQSLFGGSGEDAHLDGVDHILNAFLHFSQVLP